MFIILNWLLADKHTIPLTVWMCKVISVALWNESEEKMNERKTWNILDNRIERERFDGMVLFMGGGTYYYIPHGNRQPIQMRKLIELPFEPQKKLLIG